MKNTAIFASAAMILTTAAIASANPFSDVPASHWAYDTVKKMAEKGIVQGFPNNTFKGEGNVTRYQLALITSKLLAAVEQNPKGFSDENFKALEKLTVEFADEMAILGVKVKEAEEDVAGLKEEVATLKNEVSDIISRSANGELSKVRLSGDMLVRHTVAKEKGDTNKSNNSRTSTQLRLQMDAQVAENIKAVARWLVVDDARYLNGIPGVAGAAWNGSNHQTGDVDVAYIEVKDMFGFGGDFIFGRRFMAHGHSLLLNDNVDAITYNKRSGDVGISLNLIFDRNNSMVKGADYYNVWNLNFDTCFKGHDIYLGFYYNTMEMLTGKNEKRFDVEFGGKGILGESGHWGYDIAGVYSRLKELDRDGWMLHGAVKWDSKVEWAAKLAYTMIDKDSAGVRYVSFDERYADGYENPLEDIVRGSIGTGYARCNINGNNIQDMKAQIEYRPKNADKHYFRFAYDLVKPKDNDEVSMFFQGGDNVSDKANVFTFEYRYQLSDNARFGIGYTGFQFASGDDVNHADNAIHSRDYDMVWTELYTRF